MKTINEIKEIIPVEQSLTDRWDREWLNYFLTEDTRLFHTPYDRLELQVKNLKKKKASEVYDTSLCSSQDDLPLLPLHIWANGNDLVKKNILEIGCGPGYLGKQLGHIANSYLGIDYSKFALYLANLTSPENCFYHHISDLDGISKKSGTIDTMVGRYFYIHQNYQNAQWVLELAMNLLKSGGVVCADFYLGNPDITQGIIHPAKSPIDPNYASCAFQFSEQEIIDLAEESGLSVENVTDRLDIQRRFVRFKKP
jgi:2-polyprenyl-3-methyl-5-hydroxy-6-metoxy-1,4-benzoquinol methylase